MQLKYEIEQSHRTAEEKSHKIEKINQQLMSLEKKVDRGIVQKYLVMLSNEPNYTFTYYFLLQTDLLIQTLQSANKYALRQLLTFVENHPEMENLVKRHAKDIGLDLPYKKPSLSSICSSGSSSSCKTPSVKLKSPSPSQHSNVSVASIVLSFDAPSPVKAKDINLKGKKRK